MKAAARRLACSYLAALCLGLVLACLSMGSASAADKAEKRSDTTPYSTTECFAFWKLANKLDGAGVADLLAKGPPQSGGTLPPADMDRVTLYLKLEERIRFRCPDFVPPPVQRTP